MNAAATSHSRPGSSPRAGFQPAALPQRDAALQLDPLSAALVKNAPLRALLIQTALLAQLHGLDDDAQTIRALVVRLGVNRALFDVARAIVLLHRGEAEACSKVIERDVLLDDPGHELARAVLVCAWRHMGRSDWQSHASALLAATSDAKVRRILLHGA